MNTKRHLEKVLERIEATYWGKNRLKGKGKNHRYEYCVLGLIELTGSLPQKQYESEGRTVSRYPDTARLLIKAAGYPDHHPYPARAIFIKNDRSSRATMVAWVKRAIKLAEEE